MKITQHVLAVIASLGFAAAAQASPLSLDDAKAIVQTASGGAAHVVSTFAGPDGLTGTVIETQDGLKNIAWLTPHGDAVVINGGLIGKLGSDLTRAAMYEQGLLLKPVDALSQASAPGAHGFIAGNNAKAPILTVFFDPNCIFCHLMHQALAKPIADGRLRVRYVLVGTLKPTSAARAASILGAKDPVAAMDLDENAFDKASEEGGYPIDAKPDPSLLAAVEANSKLMGHSGGTGTPTLLYCGAKSKAVEMLIGMPQDVDALIAGLATEPNPACRE